MFNPVDSFTQQLKSEALDKFENDIKQLVLKAYLEDVFTPQFEDLIYALDEIKTEMVQLDPDESSFLSVNDIVYKFEQVEKKALQFIDDPSSNQPQEQVGSKASTATAGLMNFLSTATTWNSDGGNSYQLAALIPHSSLNQTLSYNALSELNSQHSRYKTIAKIDERMKAVLHPGPVPNMLLDSADSFVDAAYHKSLDDNPALFSSSIRSGIDSDLIVKNYLNHIKQLINLEDFNLLGNRQMSTVSDTEKIIAKFKSKYPDSNLIDLIDRTFSNAKLQQLAGKEHKTVLLFLRDSSLNSLLLLQRNWISLIKKYLQNSNFWDNTELDFAVNVRFELMHPIDAYSYLQRATQSISIIKDALTALDGENMDVLRRELDHFKAKIKSSTNSVASEYLSILNQETVKYKLLTLARSYTEDNSPGYYISKVGTFIDYFSQTTRNVIFDMIDVLIQSTDGWLKTEAGNRNIASSVYSNTQLGNIALKQALLYYKKHNKLRLDPDWNKGTQQYVTSVFSQFKFIPVIELGEELISGLMKQCNEHGSEYAREVANGFNTFYATTLKFIDNMTDHVFGNISREIKWVIVTMIGMVTLIILVGLAVIKSTITGGFAEVRKVMNGGNVEMHIRPWGVSVKSSRDQATVQAEKEIKIQENNQKFLGELLKKLLSTTAYDPDMISNALLTAKHIALQLQMPETVEMINSIASNHYPLPVRNSIQQMITDGSNQSKSALRIQEEYLAAKIDEAEDISIAAGNRLEEAEMAIVQLKKQIAHQSDDSSNKQDLKKLLEQALQHHKDMKQLKIEADAKRDVLIEL